MKNRLKVSGQVSVLRGCNFENIFLENAYFEGAILIMYFENVFLRERF